MYERCTKFQLSTSSKYIDVGNSSFFSLLPLLFAVDYVVCLTPSSIAVLSMSIFMSFNVLNLMQ